MREGIVVSETAGSDVRLIEGEGPRQECSEYLGREKDSRAQWGPSVQVCPAWERGTSPHSARGPPGEFWAVLSQGVRWVWAGPFGHRVTGALKWHHSSRPEGGDGTEEGEHL